MDKYTPLPEEDALLYIEALKRDRLPLPDNDYEFLTSSSAADLRFIKIYGLLAVRIAQQWHKKHNNLMTLPEVLATANVTLLAAREAFIGNAANRTKSFSDYARWFIKYELNKLDKNRYL